MSQEIKKSLSLEVSKETWKKLKVLSIQKEISLPELCKDVLEKFVGGKRGSTLELQEEA